MSLLCKSCTWIRRLAYLALTKVALLATGTAASDLPDKGGLPHYAEARLRIYTEKRYVIDHCGWCCGLRSRDLDWDFAPFYYAEMSDGPSPFSDPPGSNLPENPLVVKCNYMSRPGSKLNFRSARNCTYDRLQEKVLPL
jgi:hypothetical protein